MSVPTPAAVELGADHRDGAASLALTAASRAQGAAGSVPAALDVAVGLAPRVPRPGQGRTLQRWEILATLGAADLTVARVVEPHLDALAILAEARADGVDVLAGSDAAGGLAGSDGADVLAGSDAADGVGIAGLDTLGVDAGSTWGVFASEGPASTLTAAAGPRGVRLTGTKPWCSLAGALSHALVTAATDDGRRLFAVPLAHAGVRVAAVDWVSRGLAAVPSGPVEMADVPAVPVGPPGWYLDRPGFWWGGIGVAACWYGGAVGLARRAWAQAHRRSGDVSGLLLGAIDVRLHATRAALAGAAASVDAGSAGDPSLLAARVRAVVADAAESTLHDAAHLLGPAPLAFEEEYARRVADLGVYVRQHHGERDLAGLGGELAARDTAPW